MTINSSTRIAGPYTGNGSTTAFPFSFKVFSTAEVTVVQTNLSLVETTLTLGTNYTVALNANQNSNPGGTVNMVAAPASGFLITLTSSLGYTQTLDLTNQGGFYPSTINDALDRATIQIQQLNEQVGRAAKVNISSGTDSTALVNNINTVAANLSTIQAVNSNQSNINTVSSNSSSINTVSTNNSNISTVASNITAVNTAAANIAAIQNASTNASNAASSASAASTSASNAATSASTATTQATTATTQANNASTSSTNAAASESSASSSATTATNSASTATTQASNASTSASNASTSASGASTSATNAAVSASTAATQASNASTSATNAASSASAASTSASNASTSATSAASAQIAAEAARDQTLASFDSFDDRYLGAKISDPTLDNDGNALVAGALYFNSVAGVMNVYTGAAWVAAYVSGTGFVAKTGDTMTGALGVMAGSVSAPGIFASGDNNTGIFFPAADTFGISTNGTTAVSISTGQVVTLTNALPVASGGTGATSNAAAPFALKGANSDITSLTGLTTALSLAQGGTGATSSAAAPFALKGANSDITSITGLTTALTVAQGGTGAATLTANNVLLGNGTSAPQFVAPSTNGNVLTSNGTTWTSAAPSGGVTSLNGQSGAVVNTSLYAIGSYVIGRQRNSTTNAVDSTIAGSTLYASNTYWYPYNNSFYTPGTTGNASGDVLVNTGTWRCVTPTLTTGGTYPMLAPSLWVRIS